MAFTKIWIHAVWSTKARQPLLTQHRGLICQHIKDNAAIKGFHINEINGYNDPLHCLMCLSPELSIAKQMQLIKGESSYWINKQKIIPGRFDWADEYFAVSIGEKDLGWVRNYIRNQEQHHRKISFAEEYTGFLKSIEPVGG
jgi:putative transposase